MNRSNKKPSTYKTPYRNYSQNKPTKIYLDASKKETKIKEDEKQTLNNINNSENKKEEPSLEEEKKKRDKVIHENNIKVIDILQKEFGKYEKENELIIEEMKRLKQQEKELFQTYDKIRDDIETEKDELEEIKDINTEKNREYLELSRLRRINPNEQNDGNNNNNNNTRNNNINNQARPHPLNRFTLGEVMDGLLRISRGRTEEDDDSDDVPHLPFIFMPSRESNDDGPPMSYEQIQALPSSNYPRGNNNEKCTICQFDFCYNDVVTKLTKCQHIFHKSCLSNRLSARRSSKCPTCRVSII